MKRELKTQKPNKKKLPYILFLICILSAACTRTPRIDENKETEIKEDTASVREEAALYFTDLVKEATGCNPKEVRIEFRGNEKGYMKEEIKDMKKLVSGSDPLLLVGIISESEKGYSETEIHEIVMNVKEHGVTADLYFNYNDYYVYQIRHDGVVIDKTTGKDGGRMHELIEYR